MDATVKSSSADWSSNEFCYWHNTHDDIAAFVVIPNTVAQPIPQFMIQCVPGNYAIQIPTASNVDGVHWYHSVIPTENYFYDGYSKTEYYAAGDAKVYYISYYKTPAIQNFIATGTPFCSLIYKCDDCADFSNPAAANKTIIDNSSGNTDLIQDTKSVEDLIGNTSYQIHYKKNSFKGKAYLNFKDKDNKIVKSYEINPESDNLTIDLKELNIFGTLTPEINLNGMLITNQVGNE